MNLENQISKEVAIKTKVKKLIRETGEETTKLLFRSHEFGDDFFFDFDVEDNFDKNSTLNQMLVKEQILSSNNNNMQQQIINKFLEERRFNDVFDLVESDYSFQYSLLCNLINKIDNKTEKITNEKQELLQDMQNYIETEKKEKNQNTNGKILYFHTA